MSASLYSIEQLQAQLAPVFQKNGVRKAILFGSYAKGTAQPASDVDLWVDSGLRGLSFFGQSAVLYFIGFYLDNKINMW